jgi:hypothetical protein
MKHRNPHLSRREAERLLDDPTAVPSALGTALAAAGAPARANELAREDAEVAAFHTARLSPSPTLRSNFVSPTLLGKRAATRAIVATGAVVALTTGGFALANSAHLPTLPGQASDQATESVAKSRTSDATGTESTTTEPTATESAVTEAPTTDATTTESPEGESATPTPNFEGLCKAFQANDKSAHGKALDSAAFTALATEAGGKDNIATYCVALIGAPKETGRPTDKPTPGKPTARPTQAATPTKPAKPTQAATPTKPVKPTQAATGKPTDKPGKGGTKTSG